MLGHCALVLMRERERGAKSNAHLSAPSSLMSLIVSGLVHIAYTVGRCSVLSGTLIPVVRRANTVLTGTGTQPSY